jgi:hypothetical protein
MGIQPFRVFAFRSERHVIESAFVEMATRHDDRAFQVLAACSLVVMLAVSFDYGISWDEADQDAYGQLVWAYFRSGFTDQSALHFGILTLYGGLFEMVCAVAEKISPFTGYATRHLLNASVGWLGMVYAARIARVLVGPRAAVFALVLLLVSPHYFGHCMNNPKDIPFATGYVASLFYLVRASDEFPFLRLSAAVKLTLAVASAIAIRFGGLLLIGYVWLVLGWLVFASRRWRPAELLRVVAIGSAISVAALLLGTVFCPWALQSPFVRPFEALHQLAHFPADKIRVLFNGVVLSAKKLPMSYLPTIFSLTTPVPVLILGAASPLAVGALRAGDRWRFALLWLAFLFPPLYIIATHAPVYNGVRHILFVYPVFVILAAVAADTIARWLAVRASRGWVLGALAAVAAGLWDPLRFSIANHPNQVVYFNPLCGGIRGAFLRYDLDYTGQSAKQGIDWALEESGYPRDRAVRLSGPKRNAFTRAAGHYLGEYDRMIFVGWNDPPQADFDIEVLRSDPDTQKRALTKGRILHVVSADGVPLCLVRAGRAWRAPESAP